MTGGRLVNGKTGGLRRRIGGTRRRLRLEFVAPSATFQGFDPLTVKAGTMKYVAYLAGKNYAADHNHCPCLTALQLLKGMSASDAARFVMGFRDAKLVDGDQFELRHYGCCHPSSDYAEAIPA